MRNLKHIAPKIPFIYSFLRFSRTQSPFLHSCVYERFISPQDRSTYFLQQNRQIDRGNMYINRSQTHECGNWDCGRAIPFLEIFVSNFQYWFFAVQTLSTCCTVRGRLAPPSPYENKGFDVKWNGKTGSRLLGKKSLKLGQMCVYTFLYSMNDFGN